MRKLLIILFGVLMLTSCGPNGAEGNPGVIMAGAQAGGILGSIIGDSGSRYGDYHGQMWGSLIGTIAGAAIGNAISTPKKQNNDLMAENAIDANPYSIKESGTYIPLSKQSVLKIQNIRFIDDGRNQVINSNEECKIIFEVVNDTDYPVLDVTPMVEEISGQKNINISPSAGVEKIEAHDGIRYTAFVHSGGKIKDGEAVFRVYAVEQSGKVSNVRDFSIPVRP